MGGGTPPPAWEEDRCSKTGVLTQCCYPAEGIGRYLKMDGKGPLRQDDCFWVGLPLVLVLRKGGSGEMGRKGRERRGKEGGETGEERRREGMNQE